jgi:hypothetical protein
MPSRLCGFDLPLAIAVLGLALVACAQHERLKGMEGRSASSGRIQNLEDRHMELSATVVELQAEVKRLREAFY